VFKMQMADPTFEYDPTLAGPRTAAEAELLLGVVLIMAVNRIRQEASAAPATAS